MTRTPRTTPEHANPTVRGGGLVHVDPGTLQTTRNVRTDLHLDTEFQDSIATLGVQVPIVAVRGEDGALSIEHGHRRAAAAAAAGLTSVPVVVFDAEQAETLRLMGQLAENQARADLTSAELVAAHEQLSLLGVSVEQAARATGTSTDRVRAARSIAADSAAGQWLEANSATQLDLEQVAVLAEFSTDPELVATLAELATEDDPFEFARVAESARADRARDVRLAAAATEWEARGWAAVVHTHYSDPVPDTWVPAWKLRTATGARVSDEDLAQGQGRAVLLTEGWDYQSREPHIRAALYCADPEAHGYTLTPETTSWAGQNSAKSAEEKTAERRKVLATNKDWRAAETVRRAHVRDWLTTAKPTPAIHRWVLDELLRSGGGLDYSARNAFAELGWAGDVLHTKKGHTITVPPTTSGVRATVGVLTLVLAARELDTGVESWRNPSNDSSTARYLKFLVQHTGYTLGDVEKLATKNPVRKTAAKKTPAAPVDATETAAHADTTQTVDPQSGATDHADTSAQDPITASGAAATAEPLDPGSGAGVAGARDPLSLGSGDPLDDDVWDTDLGTPDVAAASR